MDDGELIPATQGKIKKVFDFSQGTNDHGDWSLQNLVVTEGPVELWVKLKNQPEVNERKAKGKMLYLEAHKSEKGLTGVAVKEDTYKNKPRKFIYVTGSATVEIGDRAQEGGESEQEPPPDEPKAPPKGKAAPAAEPPSQQGEAPPAKTEPPAAPDPKAPKPGPTDEQLMHNADVALIRHANLWRRCYAVMHKTAADFHEVTGKDMDGETIRSGTSTLFIQMVRDGFSNAMPKKLMPFKAPPKQDPAATNPPAAGQTPAA